MEVSYTSRGLFSAVGIRCQHYKAPSDVSVFAAKNVVPDTKASLSLQTNKIDAYNVRKSVYFDFAQNMSTAR